MATEKTTQLDNFNLPSMYSRYYLVTLMLQSCRGGRRGRVTSGIEFL
ncbi:hypothetical protein BDE02_02G083500 [Populus trichocarpa]|nr:hypothetical protein BDE02_02G083500 [Populus trichocarpa]